jgi:WXXGXW repeat (2 copies)
MRMQKLVFTGLAAAALASASIPALAWTVWPDVDFEWYANVGQPSPVVEVVPAPRQGYIWSPGHWETRGTHQNFVAGNFVRDDYADQLTVYNNGRTVTYATGPLILRDADGNIIPTNAEAYPVDSALR